MKVKIIYQGGYVSDLGIMEEGPFKGWLVYRHPNGEWVTLVKLDTIPDLGPDGFLWQLWENDDEITLQRRCDVKSCEKGILHTPARFCGACQGSGFKIRKFKLKQE